RRVSARSGREAVRQSAVKWGGRAGLERAISAGAIRKGLAKAATMAAAKTRKLLVIEDDARQRAAIRELVGNGTVEIVEASSAAEGLAALRDQEIGCIILDLMLPDMSGFKLIEQIRAEHQQLPVIIYTGK